MQGMLEIAVLGLLKERSMHGYQLSKQLTDTLGGFWRVSYGSLYPTLRRLEKEGAVEQVFAKEEVGRRKNVYRITAQGEELFDALILETGAQESSEDNKFRVRLRFFKYLKPETRVRLLERRRAYLEERLQHIQESIDRTQERIDSYTLSLMTHGQDSTRSDIAWLNDLITAERSQMAATASGTTKTRRQRSAAVRKEQA